MSDIFREVDEALQQEKLEKIWKEYRSTIIACIAILIVGTALTKTYHGWNANRDATETARLMTALESDNPQAAIQTVIEDTRKGHSALGLMSAAGLLLSEDKKEEAAALYKKAAESRKTPRDMRDLARILYVQNTTEGSIDILKPLLANEKSPWVWHARIEAAVLTAHQDQNYDKALEYLAPFKDVTTIPLSLKQRGQALAHVYQLKAAEQKTTEG